MSHPAGWYPDAQDPTIERYWNGGEWVGPPRERTDQPMEQPMEQPTHEPMRGPTEDQVPHPVQFGAAVAVPATSLAQPVPQVVANTTFAASAVATTGPRGGKQFAFTGGAATYLGTAILAFLITVFTLGIMYPFALVLRERWRCKHAYINGQQLQFNGLALGLFGLWIKWLFLIVITVGIYMFWVGPRIARWKWEHTGFVGHVVATPARA